MKPTRVLFNFGLLFLLIILTGCISYAPGKFRGDFPIKEAPWVREGMPIMFQEYAWYPTEDIETLLDSEMEYQGEYNQVPFYIEKRQIKPFSRIYTKFGNHRYRIFKKK